MSACNGAGDAEAGARYARLAIACLEKVHPAEPRAVQSLSAHWLIHWLLPALSSSALEN